MKNGFVTDVFYFRFNENKTKQKQKKHLTFTVFTTLIFTIAIATLLPIVYSMPDNEIELPKDISNDFKNGLVKADNFLTTGFIHDNKNYNNDDNNTKHIHRRKGGKHHHKKLHSKKATKVEYKEEHNNNSNINQSPRKYKYVEQSGNKFDYYPIEPVNISYDPKEDEKIRFVLITGNDDEKKITNENKKKRRRHKRDVSDFNEKTLRTKRNPILPLVILNPLNHIATVDDINNKINEVPSIKYAIPGLYYNAITPQKPREPTFTSTRIIDGPVWDRRPIKRIHDKDVRTDGSSSPNSINPGFSPPGILVPIKNPNTPSQSSTSVGTGAPPAVAQNENTGPSNCIWAIVNCCSKSNTTIRYGCFEQIGCVGAFWDFNPCGDNWQRKAVEEAEKFFDEDDTDY
ncbi:uncharacterized protein LOC129608907 [Condylostylus longicornis]|uniref:uncharacterized protein LOC129608907 n=1 Tax=Condylostylus longicornis TaxID=2530218 RepID=UPI00244DF665|nr:uncharacterized protein LOC129608907 [Condylostylus longicornis]XP_055376682.1 uncharacterized protein LOC129608907 [Condylostylus longicornis]